MVFQKLRETLADLPVATVAQDVVESVQNSEVSVLTSGTGSGKTLITTTLLADQSDERVVVLVPRRALASNAAETVAELTRLTFAEARDLLLRSVTLSNAEMIRFAEDKTGRPDRGRLQPEQMREAFSKITGVIASIGGLSPTDASALLQDFPSDDAGALARRVEARTGTPLEAQQQKQLRQQAQAFYKTIAGIRKATGVEVGREVGFAVGSTRGDKSNFTPDTQLIFTTYGYALGASLDGSQTKLIDSARIIVTDEVHEAGIDISIVRAILRERLEQDPSLRVLEMSATVDAEDQASYWQGQRPTRLHHAKGRHVDLETRYVDSRDSSIPKTAIQLIQEENRKGIAIFLPGKKELENTARELKWQAQTAGLDIDIRTIHGEMSGAERADALRTPEDGKITVLIGTNVIESGINVPWLDAGISDGQGRIPYYNPETEAKTLRTQDLPQWRIVQQMGRLRFGGTFVLVSETGFGSLEAQAQEIFDRIDRAAATDSAAREQALTAIGKAIALQVDLSAPDAVSRLAALIRERYSNAEKPIEAFLADVRTTGELPRNHVLQRFTPRHREERTVPELQRAPLSQLMMTCAALGRDPRELTFDSPIDPKRLQIAIEKLALLGLIEKTYRLAESQRSGPDQERSFQVGNMWGLSEAGRFVADLPVGPETGAMLWEAKRKGMLEAGIELAAVIEAGGLRENFRRGFGLDQTSDVLDSLKAYQIRRNWLKTPEKNRKPHGIENISGKRYDDVALMIQDLRKRLQGEQLKWSANATENDLREMLLAGNLHNLHARDGSSYQNPWKPTGYYGLAKDSAASGTTPAFVVAMPRGIERQRDGGTLTVLNDVTAIPPAVLVDFARAHPNTLTDPRFARTSSDDRISLQYLNGGRIEFYASTMPENLAELIEPAYTQFRYQQNLQAIARAFGIAPEVAQNLAARELHLAAAAHTLLQEHVFTPLGIQADIRLGADAPLDATEARLTTATVRSWPEAHTLSIDVPANTLEAAQLMTLVQRLPDVFSFGRQTARSQPFAFEAQDNSVILHSAADTATWTDASGRSLQDVAAATLQDGHTLTVAPARAVDTDRLRNSIFGEILNSWSSAYAPEDKELAGFASDAFLSAVRDLHLPKTASGAVTMGGQYAEALVLVPECQIKAYQKLETAAQAACDEIAGGLAARQQQVRDVRAALKDAGFAEVQLDSSYSGYRHSHHDMVTDPAFTRQVAALLQLREHLEACAAPGTTLAVEETAFPATHHVVRLTVVYKGADSLPDQQALRDRLREIDPGVTGALYNTDSRDNSVTVQFTVDVPEAARESTQTLTEMLADHPQRLAEIATLRETYWERLAEAARAAEAERVAAEEARRQQEAAEELATLKADLQWVYDNEIGVPDDFRQYMSWDRETSQNIATHPDPEVSQLLLDLYNTYGADNRRMKRIVADLEEEIAQAEAAMELEQKELARLAKAATVTTRGDALVTNSLAGLAAAVVNARQEADMADTLSAAVKAEREAAWQSYQAMLSGIQKDLKTLQQLGADRLPAEFAPYVTVQEDGSAAFTAWGRNRNSTQNDLYQDLRAGGLSDRPAAELIGFVNEQQAEAKRQQALDAEQQRQAEAARVASMDQRWGEFQNMISVIQPQIDRLRALGATQLPQEFAPYVETYPNGNTVFTAWGKKRNDAQTAAYADLRQGGVSSLSATDLLAQVTAEREHEMLENEEALLEIMDAGAPLPEECACYLALDPGQLTDNAAALLEMLQEHQQQLIDAATQDRDGENWAKPSMPVPPSVALFQIQGGSSR
jgi:HrpA-like RNA helicase